MTSRSRRPSTSPPPRVLDVVGPTGVTGTVNATWLEGPDGVVTNPAEPALPKEIVDVTATSDDLVLRGVGFRGGTYTDTPNVLPLTGAPTTELRGVHAPFVSPVFYPMRMWTSNYFGEFDSGGTNLIVTPVQHRSDPANALRSIRRVFSDLDLRLFYADAPTLLGGVHADAALADAPTIVDVDATADGSDIVFSAQVRWRSLGRDPRGLGRLRPMAAARGCHSTSSSARLRCRRRAPGSTTRGSGPDAWPTPRPRSSTSRRPRTAPGS